MPRPTAEWARARAQQLWPLSREKENVPKDNAARHCWICQPGGLARALPALTSQQQDDDHGNHRNNDGAATTRRKDQPFPEPKVWHHPSFRLSTNGEVRATCLDVQAIMVSAKANTQELCGVPRFCRQTSLGYGLPSTAAPFSVTRPSSAKVSTVKMICLFTVGGPTRGG